MEEVWRAVVGYEGLYEVSSTGIIRNAKTKKYIVQSTINGYFRVNLWKENKYKTRRVHRLVAEAFIPNPKNKRTVNHKDGNKQNNCVENLEWMTHSENNKHAYNNGMKTNNTPIIIDGEITFVSQSDAAKYLGVSQSFVSSSVHNGRRINGHTVEFAQRP